MCYLQHKYLWLSAIVDLGQSNLQLVIEHQIKNIFTQSAIQTLDNKITNNRNRIIVCPWGQSINMTRYFTQKRYNLDMYDIL